MDQQDLRIALIVIGAVIIVAIMAFWGISNKRRQKNVRRRLETRMPTDSGLSQEPSDSDSEHSELGVQQEMEALRGMGEIIAADKAGLQVAKNETETEIRADEVPAKSNSNTEKASATRQPSAAQKPKGPRPDKVITLYLQSIGKQRVHGNALLNATVQTGLVYGNMKLFHRVPAGSKQSLFSLANGLKPGTFEPTEWNVLETPMLTLFFSLPAPFEGLEAWESMHATATRLADLLNLAILDHQQMPLSRERIGEIREELRQYDRDNPR